MTIREFICRHFGHSKKTVECVQGGHHCRRCGAYLSVRTHKYLNVRTHKSIYGWPLWTHGYDCKLEDK